MHKLLTLRYFLEKYPSDLQTFFDSKVLSPKNYRVYIELGHLLESLQEYKIRDLYEYNAAATSIIWALAKYPFKKINKESNLYFLGKFILKLVLHNLRSMRNIVFSIEDTGDIVDQKKGDRKSLEIIDNHYQLGPIDHIHDFEREIIDFVNRNSNLSSRNNRH